MPSVEVNAYLYLLPAKSTGAPYRVLRDREVLYPNLLSLELSVQQPNDTYGITMQFSNEREALLVGDSLSTSHDQRSRTTEVSGRTITVLTGSGRWVESLRQASASNERSLIEDRYPDVAELMPFLPASASLKPVAVGFVRNSPGLIDPLLEPWVNGASDIGSFLGLVRLQSLAFGFYLDGTDLLALPVSSASMESIDFGVIAVGYVGYPRYIVNFLVDEFGKRLGLHAFEVSGEEVLYLQHSDRFHIMVATDGKVLFFAIATRKEQAQRLIQATMINRS